MSLSHYNFCEIGTSYPIRDDNSLLYFYRSQDALENKPNDDKIFIAWNEKVSKKHKTEEESENNLRNHMNHHAHNT